MIPALVDLGSPSPWRVLPPGIHDTSLDEIEKRFATTPHRKSLFEGLLRAIASLEGAGCKAIYLDGSFVTDKPHPSDYDGCWEVVGVDPNKLDPVLLDFSGKREAQKRKFSGELFFAEKFRPGDFDFLGFFQIEKFSGLTKGILRVKLSPNRGPSP